MPPTQLKVMREKHQAASSAEVSAKVAPSTSGAASSALVIPAMAAKRKDLMETLENQTFCVTVVRHCNGNTRTHTHTYYYDTWLSTLVDMESFSGEQHQ